MKTRVTEHFDTKFGIYCYWVWKWALWDPPDLRKMYPNAYGWRHVIYLPDKDRAVAIARQLSVPLVGHPDIPTVEVVELDGLKLVPLIAEFGEEN